MRLRLRLKSNRGPPRKAGHGGFPNHQRTGLSDSDCILRRGLPRTQAAGGRCSQSQSLGHRDNISMTRINSRLRHSISLPNETLKMQIAKDANKNTAVCALDLVTSVSCELSVSWQTVIDTTSIHIRTDAALVFSQLCRQATSPWLNGFFAAIHTLFHERCFAVPVVMPLLAVMLLH